MSAKTEPTAAGCLSAAAAMTIIVVISPALFAFVLRLLWRWYVVADLSGPPLSWHAALGLGVIVSYMTKQVNPNDERTPMQIATSGIAIDVVALGMGWLYHVTTRGLS